ncbi:MAG: Gfo/Idh/MocA family oxidoreductase [Flavobacteriales bacterium]|nr:Gfo/Idh/MocA family oxidoreductase [Flavobacteriales bacterium]
MKLIGIIGCGAVTESFYLKVFPNFAGFKLAYLADMNVEQANRLASIVGATVLDTDSLIQKSDIVIVCTPPSSHFVLAKQALDAGKTVICEKPFVPSATLASELILKSKEKNSKLYVAHFRRAFPSVLLAKSLIKSVGYGRLKHINVSEGGRFTWKAKSDYFATDSLGGVILDTGSHTIDMALFMAGLDDVSNLGVQVLSIKKDKEEPAHEVSAELALKLLDQAESIDVSLHLSRYQILANQIVYTFEKGKIIVPIAPGNFVKLDNGHKTIVRSLGNTHSAIEGFFKQYQQILYQVNDHHFDAAKFYNLTNVLEQLSNIEGQQ